MWSRRTLLQGAFAGMTSGVLPAELRRDQIDLDHEHQLIENFGASDAWSMQKLGTWSLGRVLN
jgi:hypothetical protein